MAYGLYVSVFWKHTKVVSLGFKFFQGYLRALRLARLARALRSIRVMRFLRHLPFQQRKNEPRAIIIECYRLKCIEIIECILLWSAKVYQKYCLQSKILRYIAALRTIILSIISTLGPLVWTLALLVLLFYLFAEPWMHKREKCFKARKPICFHDCRCALDWTSPGCHHTDGDWSLQAIFLLTANTLQLK